MDKVLLGVVLCEIAVFCIALGANVPRYALTRVPPERKFHNTPLSCATATWLGGLFIYFLGNCFFVLALAFAPASLCAALLATVVVMNAIIARLLLKEQQKRSEEWEVKKQAEWQERARENQDLMLHSSSSHAPSCTARHRCSGENRVRNRRT